MVHVSSVLFPCRFYKVMGLKWLLFLTSPLLLGMKHAINTRWSANLNQGHSHCPHNLLSKGRFSCSLIGHIVPHPTMLAIELIMVIIF